MSTVKEKSSSYFFTGFSSAWNISPTIDLPKRFDSAHSGIFIDLKALENDWEKIGSDIKTAVKNYENSRDKDSEN